MLDCPKDKVKCNNKCQKPNKPCPSKTPKPPKTTSTDDYPSYPTEYPTYPEKRSADAYYDEDEDEYTPLSTPHHLELDDFLSSTGTIDSEDGYADLLDFVATATFAVRDLPEPTLLQQYYRATSDKTCEPGWVPCAVLKKGKADWECTDVQNALDSCTSPSQTQPLHMLMRRRRRMYLPHPPRSQGPRMLRHPRRERSEPAFLPLARDSKLTRFHRSRVCRDTARSTPAPVGSRTTVPHVLPTPRTRGTASNRWGTASTSG